MSAATPYISFVIAGRNDDYGGDFNDRLTNSLTQLTYLAEKYQLQAEYLIVNYNPLQDKPSLASILKFPDNRRFLKFRILTVSNEIHRSLENSKLRRPLPLYEYVAKNAGIRRANGEYICAANPDIIFHPKIIQWLSKKPLKKNEYYRTDRCDFKKPEKAPPADAGKFLQWLKPHLFRTYLKGNHYDHGFSPEVSLPFLRAFNKIYLQLDLLFAKHPYWAKPVFWEVNYHNAEFRYHCNVSGDFMMMHRDNWFRLHAYPETTYIALHTDALFVVTSGVSGLQEKVLKWPIFHQDHGRRYDATKDMFDKEMRDAYLSFQQEAQQMIQKKEAKIFNNDDWGLKDHVLEEQIF